jgi:hypothetical protein
MMLFTLSARLQPQAVGREKTGIAVFQAATRFYSIAGVTASGPNSCRFYMCAYAMHARMNERTHARHAA